MSTCQNKHHKMNNIARKKMPKWDYYISRSNMYNLNLKICMTSKFDVTRHGNND